MKHIPLTKGMVVIVDDEDYDFLMQWKWHAIRSGASYYAARRTRLNPPVGNKRQGVQFMHRFIMGEPEGVVVDHRNRNTLDNRRQNLRTATASQNSMNRTAQPTRSPFKGVAFGKQGWQAQIMVNGRARWLGYHPTEVDAARAYDAAARQYHGEFAYLNFPEG